jgi:N-carbamoyl-L-amino-acid hydrolase
MARLGPIGMVFTPSIGGVSHAAGEATSPDHLIAGADVLYRALLLADARLSTTSGRLDGGRMDLG